MRALTNIDWYLSLATGIIAALCGVAGIIPDSHMKYYMAAIAVMTFLKGFLKSNPPPQVTP